MRCRSIRRPYSIEPASKAWRWNPNNAQGPGRGVRHEGLLAGGFELHVLPLQADRRLAWLGPAEVHGGAHFAAVNLEQRADRAVGLELGVPVIAHCAAQLERRPVAGGERRARPEIEPLLLEVDGDAAPLLLPLRHLHGGARPARRSGCRRGSRQRRTPSACRCSSRRAASLRPAPAVPDLPLHFLVLPSFVFSSSSARRRRDSAKPGIS